MKEYHLFIPKCIVVVVRDDLGRVVAALSKRINAPLGAVEVELRLSKQVYSSQRISGCRTSFRKVIPSESIIIQRALSRLVPSSSSVDSLISCMQELCGEFSGVFVLSCTLSRQ